MPHTMHLGGIGGACGEVGEWGGCPLYIKKKKKKKEEVGGQLGDGILTYKATIYALICKTPYYRIITIGVMVAR